MPTVAKLFTSYNIIHNPDSYSGRPSTLYLLWGKFTARNRDTLCRLSAFFVRVIKDSYFTVKPAGAELALITEWLSFPPNDL